MNLRGQAGMIIPLVFLVVFILISWNLMPTVANSSQLMVGNASGYGPFDNGTTAGKSLVGLLPLLFVVIVVVSILGFVAMRR